jgi:hypothetical protein
MGAGANVYGVQSDMTGSFSASVIRTNNVDAATKMHPKPKAMQGKMEKSFFSFKVRLCFFHTWEHVHNLIRLCHSTRLIIQTGAQLSPDKLSLTVLRLTTMKKRRH